MLTLKAYTINRVKLKYLLDVLSKPTLFVELVQFSKAYPHCVQQWCLCLTKWWSPVTGVHVQKL